MGCRRCQREQWSMFNRFAEDEADRKYKFMPNAYSISVSVCVCVQQIQVCGSWLRQGDLAERYFEYDLIAMKSVLFVEMHFVVVAAAAADFVCFGA